MPPNMALIDNSTCSNDKAYPVEFFLIITMAIIITIFLIIIHTNIKSYNREINKKLNPLILTVNAKCRA